MVLRHSASRRLPAATLVAVVGFVVALLSASPAEAGVFGGLQSGLQVINSTHVGTVGPVVSNGDAGPTYAATDPRLPPPTTNTAAAPDDGTVTLNSSLTIINMNDFNLTQEDTLNFAFLTTSHTVLIRVGSGAATVNGTLNANLLGGGSGGNIWISAPGGVVFGPDADVDVGGLLTTTAAITDADFLSENAVFYDGANSISMVSGASIVGHGGLVAFVAPLVVQGPGAAVDASTHGDVLYGAAASYSVSTASPGGFVRLLGVHIASSTNLAAPLDLAGTTSGGDIFIASGAGAPSGASLRAEGLSAAGFPASGQGNLVVSAGGNLTRSTLSDPMQPVADSAAAAQNVTLGVVEAIGAVRGRSFGAVTIDAAGRLPLGAVDAGGPVSVRAAGEIVAKSTVTASGNALLHAGGDLDLQAGARVSGSAVALSTAANFLNNRGADVANATGHWVVYAADQAGNVYGGLDSGRTALWGADLSSRAPSSISGNRYVFAHSPLLVFSSDDLTKDHGVDATRLLTYSVTGYEPAVAGAYLGDDASTTYTGEPNLTSDGAPASAPVGGRPYTIQIEGGSVATTSGYSPRFRSAGQLWVNDITPPIITPTITGTEGSNGWYTSDVLVEWSVTEPDTFVDETDGCGDASVQSDTTGVTFTCTATSEGGTDSVSVTIKRDATDPTSVAAALNRPADHNGWHNAPVGWTTSGTDATSGVASCSTGTYSGPDGVGRTVSGTCTDAAGNESAAAVSAPFDFDDTAPVADVTLDRAPDHNGWYTAPVGWTVGCSDDTSGPAPAAGGTYSGPDGAAVTVSGACTDNAGNAAAADSSSPFDYDATAPTLSPSVSPNPVLLNGTATASASATDATSGVASASCDPVDATSVGAKTLTCSATDDAGHSASATAAYRVGFKFVGFASPVNNGDVLNKAKAGQAIPLKWRILDANDAPVTTLASVTVKVASLDCALGESVDALEEYAAGSSGLQNLGDGYYQLNWKSQSSYAGSCKTLKLDLGEGTPRSALFRFVK